jgi:hypothetical protein
MPGIRVLLGLLVAWTALSTPAGEAGETVRDRVLRRTQTAYHDARTAHFSHPTNVIAAWQFSRTCFDRAFSTESKSMRAAFAEEGIAAARAATRSDPKSAAAWYYLALNVGQLASTKTLGALSLVADMETHLLQARTLDKTFDHGGPDRTLGLLYRDAPGWPLSVGSRKKARKHLEAAVAIAPDYFENRLNLLESFIEWREKTEALAEYRRTAPLLAKARAKLAGPEWEASWLDWNARWPEAEKKVRKWLPEE